MSRLLRFIIITFTIVTALGCAPPIGYIGSDTESGDFLIVVPARIVYFRNELFRRQEDLAVFTSIRGNVQPVAIDQVEISIIEDPDFLPDEQNPINATYLLAYTGRKVVVVNYAKEGMSNRYSIDVRDPFGGGDNGNGNGGDDSGGIGFVWWDKVN